jgi:amino acid adenylation domain-containing protein
MARPAMSEDHVRFTEWNNTQKEYPRDRCIHQLFEEWAGRTPDATALVYGNRKLTYRELDERAGRLAACLRGAGVGPNILVGIYLHRCLEMVISLLAVLKAGGAYVPLDPAYPRKRIAGMMEDVNLKVVLTRQALLEGLPGHQAQVVCVDEIPDHPGPDGFPVSWDPPGVQDLAYVIFTSGSTGRAKAAGVFHRGWTNLMHWFVTEFEIQPRDKTLIISSFSFDITQRSIVMPLIRGAELHLLASDSYDLTLIHQTIHERQITLLNCAPSAFYPLVETLREPPTRKLGSLRILFLGGEAISARRIRKWAEAPECATEVANVYGAAECTDVSSFYRLKNYQSYVESSVPIGTPIFNTQIYILDDDLNPVPFGATGEICIAGDGVGRGYINDQTLTAEKFVDSALGENRATKLYRTGDLARFLPDGNLEFMGRTDHQVKIRGFRVDLGDIESALRQHPGIKEAVALTKEGRSGERRVAAYVVPREPEASREYSDQLLKSFLRERLPEYMLPSEFFLLQEMPLSPNGKADRNALRDLVTPLH